MNEWKETIEGTHQEHRLYADNEYAGRVCHLHGGQYRAVTTTGLSQVFEVLVHAKYWLENNA